MDSILVTGAAGFIGFHVTRRLVADGHRVVGLDNLDAYYDVSLKRDRLAQLTGKTSFAFVEADLVDRAGMEQLFDRHKPTVVIHLGAQPGVRYSMQNPYACVQSNIIGSLHVLEGARRHGARHVVLASSSSVYGSNSSTPSSEHESADHPVSLYAASKKSGEVMAHSYSHLYGLPCTALRFFTVYGPWGRPDMAYFKFARAIVEGRPIELFNSGNMERDFTYIDDVVEGIVRVTFRPAAPDVQWNSARPDPATSSAPYRVYNIGNHAPESLHRFVELLEQALGRHAVKKLLPMQPGDVLRTCADVSDLTRDVGFAPSTPLDVGIPRFVSWFRHYYGVA